MRRSVRALCWGRVLCTWRSRPRRLPLRALKFPADPWALGAVSVITTLTGSGLLALALAHSALDAEAVWAAAHVDEDWQMSQWGSDDDALERRATRRAEFDAALAVLRSGA